MTLNILFFTITVRKRNRTVEDMMREEKAYQMLEENKQRQFNMYHPF
ncbi:uncharacterized protein (TIGR02413 family) [Cytobacillus horneckiae]|uniref:YrzI family small protein n=1 Tax=Cytobacillus horneckiae TaxID=549687 RepID=A0A2N0ZIB6_9BACI|nr:YrzI family small protein [Cytobacillus horneckiae]NRG43930.1 YrzI family small protein [Bacillus sp. CRN 9]MBN6887784.1 YrzI family small protein [Cytobacillus horneckiae]MCM3179860.1 YrzI family small protein [Cytobacillus horneckiae]MEC1155249.1 YrzI family small protein [Cytobacillus horneckiae]MED2936698.1 YrzI family small protein [Cytobacillus horneckiae]